MEELDVLRGLNICCVDDDFAVLENTVEYLNFFSANVYSCNDPLEAKEILEKESIDILISDVKMHHINGIELVEWIRQKQLPTKTILMSAYFEPEIFTKAIELKTDHFLMKPYNKEELNKALSACGNAAIVERQKKSYSNVQCKEELFVDEVTKLPNQNKLLEDLKKQENPGVIMFELAGLEEIDYMYGMEISNLLLHQIASFFAVQAPRENSLYRYQYNQFCILVDNYDELAVRDLITTFDNLVLISEFEAYGVTVHFTLQYGISLDPLNPVEKAYKALMQTKTTPNQKYTLYDDQSRYILQQRKNLEFGIKIKQAIESMNIIAHYQPIVNLTNNAYEKYEALMRMKDGNVMISPGDFIPVGKNLGLHRALTKQMINQSFKKFCRKDAEVALNLSLEDFETSDIPNFLKRRVNDFGINPHQVVLEVTEDISLEEHRDILTYLKDFKNEGFKIAIDDFGTQKANFQNICSIGPDYIKIDGVFIKDIDTNEQNFQIVKGIVMIAQNIGAKTIAEFVHSREILEIVKEIGIDYAQGFLLGAPQCALKGENE